MCYLIFIGSDNPIEEIEWDEDNPNFYLSYADGDIEKAKINFSKKCVCYAGSHEGCGCGFIYDQEDDDVEKRKGSVIIAYCT